MAHSRKISGTFVSINNVLDKDIKLEVMNRPEINFDNSIKTFRAEPVFGNKYFNGYGRTYFKPFFKFIKLTVMKATSFYFLFFIGYLFHLVSMMRCRS
jgi:hypothetical protein